jgi:hypothetical protein
MKLRLFIILTVFFIALKVHSAYTEEITGKQPALKLSDKTTGFPVLKNLFDNRFFNNNNLITQYIPLSDIDKNNFPMDGNLKLTSELIKSKDIDSASFIIFFSTSIKQNILLSWDVPADNKGCQKTSIRTFVDFARNAGNSTVPEAFIRTQALGGLIESMDVKFKDNNLNTEIDRYNITVRTGFSNTHRFFRTLTELCFLNSIGMANYWINKEANMEDWRYKYSWKDAKRRFSDGWSYDTNAFRTNTLYHFYSGAVYYNTARSNDYGILASTAWAFTSSFIWENIGEWREKTSANDMIFTTMGGMLLGEALRQSSIYVERCLDYSVYGSILACFLDPMRIINRALDRSFSSSYKVSIVFVNPAAQAIMEKNR